MSPDIGSWFPGTAGCCQLLRFLRQEVELWEGAGRSRTCTSADSSRRRRCFYHSKPSSTGSRRPCPRSPGGGSSGPESGVWVLREGE